MASQDRIRTSAIAAVNSGSSTLKLTLYADEDRLTRLAAATVDRIGLAGTRINVAHNGRSKTMPIDDGSVGGVLNVALDALQQRTPAGGS